MFGARGWWRWLEIKGQGQNLGGDEEISLYKRGQVRVRGSQWHQLKFGVVVVGEGREGRGHFIYHFHFQLDCPPPPSLALAGSS